MVEAESLSFAYQHTPVLSDVSFSLGEAETLGVIGPNGSGKSTLVKLVSGLLPPASGEVRLCGRPLAAYSRRELARRVAVLPQDPLPPIDLTVSQVIRMGRFPYENWWGQEARDVSPLIDEVVRMTGIAPLLHRSVGTLSGGERQRVAIAKAMVQEPRVLVLDEPTAFLDIAFQVQMLKIIRKWQRESGLAVIIVLHDLNLAAQVCDRLLLLNRGRVAAEGPPAAVLTPETLYDVFDVRVRVVPHAAGGVPHVWLDEWDETCE